MRAKCKQVVGQTWPAHCGPECTKPWVIIAALASPSYKLLGELCFEASVPLSIKWTELQHWPHLGFLGDTEKAKCCSTGWLGRHSAHSKCELLPHFPNLVKTLCSFCQTHPGYHQTGSRIFMSLTTKKHSRIFILASAASECLWALKHVSNPGCSHLPVFLGSQFLQFTSWGP